MPPIRGNRPNHEYLPSVNGNTGVVPATRQGANGIPPTIGVNTIIRPEPAPEPLPEPAPILNGINGVNGGVPVPVPALNGVNGETMGAPSRRFVYSPEMEEYFNQLPPNKREEAKRLTEQYFSARVPSAWDAYVRTFPTLTQGFIRPGNTRALNRLTRGARANNRTASATRARAPPPMPGPRVRPPAPPKPRPNNKNTRAAPANNRNARATRRAPPMPGPRVRPPAPPKPKPDNK